MKLFSLKNITTKLALLAAGVMLLAGFAGCGTGRQDAGIANGGQNGLQIVTTIFPEYDWVREILGENPANAEVTMLLDNGVDLHSFQPTAADILKISTCDIFIYVGGESDGWVDDALQEATNKDMVVINLLETLGDRVKEEEIVEGMEGEEPEEAEHAAGQQAAGDQTAVEAGNQTAAAAGDQAAAKAGHEAEEEEAEYDEHVWLSLKNACVLCDAIADGLEAVDAANADTYKANVESYKSQLMALDADYQNAVAAAPGKTVLFGDRFPFRYLVDDYGLDYYAAFVGCSAETEASFETVVFLANKTDELGLPAILALESSDGRIAETIKSNTAAKNQQILKMDSMQSTSSKDVANGATYLDIMRKNLEVLGQAL